MLWLVGDSIFRGFALGVFADALAADDPRQAEASPAAVINRMAGREVARCAAITGLPDKVPAAIEAIAALPVAPGDVIAMLDAGDHGSDPDAHQASWARLIAAARRHGVRVIVCSAPDNLAERNWSKRRFKPGQWHALPFAGRSHNDAVQAAASDAGVEFLDLARAMHDFHARLRHVGEGAYLPDDIHPNVQGQAELCRLLFDAAWPQAAD